MSSAPFFTNILSASASTLSFGGSLFILVCYTFFRRDLSNVRHRFIFCLALADCINACNNAISGWIRVSLGPNGYLQSGPACDANGYIGQFSISAVDWSVLAITLITYFALAYPQKFARLQTVWRGLVPHLLLVLPWCMGTLTATLAMVVAGYSAASSANWCWINGEPPYWRYVFGHGPRIVIMCVIILLYIHLFLVLRVHQRRAMVLAAHSSPANTPLGLTDSPQQLLTGPALPATTVPRAQASPCTPVFDPSHLPRTSSRSPSGKGDPPSLTTLVSPPLPTYTAAAGTPSPPPYGDSPSMRSNARNAPFGQIDAATKQQQQQQRRYRKAMLRLTLYPTIYILIWSPGLVQRALEAFNGSAPPLLNALFSIVTQLLGLADAILYGWNENVRQLYRRRVPSFRHAFKSFLLCGKHTSLGPNDEFVYSEASSNYVFPGKRHVAPYKSLFYDEAYHRNEKE